MQMLYDVSNVASTLTSKIKPADESFEHPASMLVNHCKLLVELYELILKRLVDGSVVELLVTGEFALSDGLAVDEETLVDIYFPLAELFQQPQSPL